MERKKNNCSPLIFCMNSQTCSADVGKFKKARAKKKQKTNNSRIKRLSNQQQEKIFSSYIQSRANFSNRKNFSWQREFLLLLLPVLRKKKKETSLIKPSCFCPTLTHNSHTQRHPAEKDGGEGKIH